MFWSNFNMYVREYVCVCVCVSECVETYFSIAQSLPNKVIFKNQKRYVKYHFLT